MCKRGTSRRQRWAAGIPDQALGRANVPPPWRRAVGYAVAWGLLATVVVALTGCGSSTLGNLAHASTPPTSPLQDYTQGEAQRAAGRCDQAIPLYLRAISKNGMYVNAYSALSNCYQNLGSYDAAIVELDKAIAIDPTNYGLYMNRAYAEALNGSTGLAAGDDMLALRLAPPQVPAYVSIANSFSSFQDFADAVKAYDKAIALVPNNPSLYEQRAGLYLQMQDPSHAFTDYRRAVQVAPFVEARGSIYSDLANVYSQQGDMESALRTIAVAIKLQPDNARYYIQAGNIDQGADRLADALARYNQALRLVNVGPTAQTALEDQGDVLVTLGRAKDAVAAYKQSYQLLLTSDVYGRARLKGKIKAAQSGQS